MIITRIEDALISKVQSILGGRVRTVESLPADWDGDTLNRLLRQAPGVFIAFGGGVASPGGGSQSAMIIGRWSVVALTAHASGEQARRRGDSREIGAYEMVQTLVPALHGFKPADTSALLLDGVENLYTGELDRKGVSLYSIAFSQRITFPQTEGDSLHPFISFHADIDAAPVDGAPEIVANVTLPQ